VESHAETTEKPLRLDSMRSCVSVEIRHASTERQTRRLPSALRIAGRSFVHPLTRRRMNAAASGASAGSGTTRG
jgi:hypothetical protein